MSNNAVNDTDYVAIQRFLYHEAALLDARDYAAWLDLLTEDAVYRVTAQLVRRAEDGIMRYAIIDERADDLRMRVDQLADPALTHAENPPTLTRRFLSNFRVTPAEGSGGYTVVTNLLVYFNRTTVPDGSFYVGERRDVLRKSNDTFRIAERSVDLDRTALRDGTLSTLL